MNQREIKKFEAKMGWNRTKSSSIIKFIKKDAKELKSKNAKHKLIDIVFECIQLANRKDIDLSKELKIHIKNAKIKYSVKK